MDSKKKVVLSRSRTHHSVRESCRGANDVNPKIPIQHGVHFGIMRHPVMDVEQTTFATS